MTDDNSRLKGKHVAGMGAAVCAVCCAGPVLALLGIAGAGAGATLATFAFAGIAFAAVVLAATLGAIWLRRRSARVETCESSGSSCATGHETSCGCGSASDPEPEVVATSISTRASQRQ